jgi:hypothetical protein
MGKPYYYVLMKQEAIYKVRSADTHPFGCMAGRIGSTVSTVLQCKAQLSLFNSINCWSLNDAFKARKWWRRFCRIQSVNGPIAELAVPHDLILTVQAQHQADFPDTYTSASPIGSIAA